MQRYNLHESEMIDDCDGKYVLHEDAQSEINRLRAENERLRDALGGMLRSYFLVINDPLMERRDSLRAFILGVFSGDPQAATDALQSAPNAPDNRGA